MLMGLSLPAAARGRPVFATRQEAGRLLAARLGFREPAREALVLAISARALPVACATARELPAPFDLALVRHLCLPGGIGIGAVVRGVMLTNDGVVGRMRVAPALLETLALEASEGLAREEAALRSGWLPVSAAGRTAVLVDDGFGDPSDWTAAARALRCQNARRVLLAAPAIEDTAHSLIAGVVDEVVTALAGSDSAGPPCYEEDEEGFAAGSGLPRASHIPAGNL